MPSLGPSPALNRALAESLSSGSFIDTKFYAFSRRRTSDGKVDQPKALYANSAILKERSSYFASMLSAGFAEATLKDMAGEFPEEETPYVDFYDYGSDSDLDDFEDEQDTADERVSDIDGECTTPTVKRPATLVRSGPVVIIKDAAFLTLWAVLVFLHTGEIHFGQKPTEVKLPGVDRDEIPRPSAKSVYRLADKYGLEELKKIAFKHIETVLLPVCGIVEETFSEFTSRYPEIRKLQVQELHQKLRAHEQYPDEVKSLFAQIDRLGAGDIAHSCEALVELASALSGVIPEEPMKRDTETKKLNAMPTPPTWENLKKAVLESICVGKFIDSRIYLRLSASRSDRRALYFSKTALGDCYVNIRKQETKFNEESDVSDIRQTDSDLEDELIPHTLAESGVEVVTDSPSSNPKAVWEKIHARTAASALTGSYRTWMSALNYIYSGEVSFAPLTSQTAGSPSKKGSALHGSSFCPSCSPKSMYIIAPMLGLQSLQVLALESLMSKVDADNVTEEMFSKFSSSHTVVLDLQTRAFLNLHKRPKVLEILTQTIRSITTKADLHRATALRFIFAEIIRRNKEVMLKCVSDPNHVGTKEGWKKDEECPRCHEKQACCDGCGHVAHFMKVFNEVKTCPGCGSRLKVS